VTAAALLAAAGCGEDGGASLTGRVVSITDGDTIRVRLASGREERVRYIGIDTPERGDCFSRRATAVNARLVAGGEVRLERDADERDRYGRLLAYVYAGDVFVNRELVRRGVAQPLTVPPNVRHADEFRRLAERARREGSGLWSACSS
jgi:micrococcal nuclease